MTAMADFSPHTDDVALLMFRRDPQPEAGEPDAAAPEVPSDIPGRSGSLVRPGMRSSPCRTRST